MTAQVTAEVSPVSTCTDDEGEPNVFGSFKFSWFVCASRVERKTSVPKSRPRGFVRSILAQGDACGIPVGLTLGCSARNAGRNEVRADARGACPGGRTLDGVSLTVSPSPITSGGQLTISWVAPSGRSCIGGGDWIAIFRVGTARGRALPPRCRSRTGIIW